MVESRRTWIWIRRIPRRVTLSSFHLGTNNLSFAKSPLGSLIMLFKLRISLTASSPALSHPKQSGIYSRRTTFTLLLRRSALFLRSDISRIISNLPSTMKIGQWRIGRGSYGQMRPRSTGLGQMKGPTLGNKGVNLFQTIPPLLLSSMEGGIISWYRGVWDRMGLGSS